MTKTSKAPAFELVAVGSNGEEELLGSGTFKSLQKMMQSALDQADEDYTINGIEAYTPMRIQPYQGE